MLLTIVLNATIFPPGRPTKSFGLLAQPPKESLHQPGVLEPRGRVIIPTPYVASADANGNLFGDFGAGLLVGLAREHEGDDRGGSAPDDGVAGALYSGGVR